MCEKAEATDPVAWLIRLIIHGGRVNKAYYTRQPGGYWAIHPAAVQIIFVYPTVITGTCIDISLLYHFSYI